jgi:hypothetical protein
MLTLGKRLDFEGEALAQIYSPAITKPRRRAKTGFFSGAMAVTLVLSGAVLGGGMLVQNGLFGTDRRAITRTTEALLGGLATQNDALALSVCAESEEGARKLADVEEQSFGAETAVSELDVIQSARLDVLHMVRVELANAGVDWNDIRPVAFGGIRGRVIEPGGMHKPVTSLTGSVYFASRGQLYALEFSAWRCKGDYVVTEVWQGSEVTVGYEDLKTLSAAQFQAFERENPEPDSPVQIEYPKHLFFNF